MSGYFGLRANEFARKRFLVQPLLICLVVFAIAFGSLAYVTTFSARQLDESAQSVSRQLLATGLQLLSQEVAGLTQSFASSDVTFNMAMNGIDQEWADATIGAYMRTEHGLSGTYVLAPDHSTIFAENADGRFPPEARDFLKRHTYGILQQAQSQPMTSAYPVTSFLAFDERLFLVAAAPITPQTQSAVLLTQTQRPVLIFHREVNALIEIGLAGFYEIEGLRLRPQRSGADDFPIEAYDGTVVAWATWAHPRPGDTLINRLLPAVFIATAVLLIASAAVYTMWFRSALAASKAKSAFFAKMTHELRTPLNAINGFSELMSSEMMGPLSPKYRQYAYDINWSGQHLKQLIEDVLDVSKMEADGIELRENEVDVNKLLDEIAQLSLPELGIPASNNRNRMFRFQRQVDSNLPKLKADELRVRQVLINLLSNAAKYSDGGEITVRAYLGSLGGIRIDVIDQGRGIPEQDMDRVFTPFFQSGNEDMEQPRLGTGLGLSIARDLMRLHGGTLELESQIDVGTTAFMEFPKRRTIKRKNESPS